MGSRLRPDPERVLECLIEVSAPTSDQGAKLLSYYPETYEDVDMLRDVVPKFCFPYDRDSEMVDAVQHFTFVLTDIDGLYRFGFCRYPPKAKTCLCILSDLPAFGMCYGMLNTLAELEKNAQNESLTVKQFMDLALKSDVPKPDDKLIIEVPGKQWKKEYNYLDPAKLPSIPENRNLTDYFCAVNPNSMIALFASMMCERRIIVTSKKLSLLTACTYSASSLLYPMHWQHVFIPVIPPSLLDYCCAPMPFLVGVHSSLMTKVRDMPLDDVVILDVDKNEIELPLSFNDLDNIPSEAVHKLNSTLKKSTNAIGDYVSRAFLSAVVVLIGAYRNGFKFSPSSDNIVFDRELFINSRPNMKPFLENLLTLQLFERFVHHRLEQLNSGENFDDFFEELVSQQEENNSKWTSQYKQWLKNGKKKVMSIGGKTEKATYKAHRFFQSGFVHGKAGWKEAVKGMKEKKNDLLEFVKKKDVESDENFNNPGCLKKSNSLPMKKSLGVNPPPIPSRKSIGSTLHNQILAGGQADPKKSPCPSRPPPRAPPPARPPRCPPPYHLSPPTEEESSPGTLRKSMCRNPNDPPIRDLITFFNSQEDLDEPGKSDPFQEFEEFDSNSGGNSSQGKPKENDVLESNRSSSIDSGLSDENKEGLLWDTMISLSPDTRHFLRNSRLSTSQGSDETSLENGRGDAPDSPRNAVVKKTLKELAMDHSNSSGSLTHSGSCPSLFDPLANRENSENYLQNWSALSSEKTRANLSNENLKQLEKPHSQRNSDDPFLELINKRHNLKLDALNLADS